MQTVYAPGHEGCGPNQVFQNGQCLDIDVSGPQAFVVETDQPSYEDGDTIRITGNVGTVSTSNPDLPLTIIVIGPDGKTVAVAQTIPSSNGGFSHTLIAGGSMQESGVYEVTAKYGTQASTTTFYFESSSSTTPTITVSTDRYSYKEGDIIRISGKVSDILSGFSVSLSVFSPQGLRVAIAQPNVDFYGNYSTELTAGGAMQETGTYVVKVIYGSEARKAETTFYFESSSPSPVRLNIGEVHWVEASYPASGSGVVRVIDPDMNLDPEAKDNFDVDVWSDSDARGIDLTVTETNEATGIFEGTVFFTTTYESSGHRLRVSEGDTITAEYQDNTLPDPYTSSDELDITGTTIIRDSSSPPNVSFTNPRIIDAFGNTLHSVSAGQRIQIVADIENQNNFVQIFVFYVEVRETGHESWISGSLSAGQSFSPARSWTPDADGTYTIDITIFDDLERRNVLAPTLTIQVIVGSGGGTILDTVPPQILQPKDIVVDAEDGSGIRVNFEVLAIDDVDQIVKPSCSPSSGSFFPVGDTKVVCSAFDSAGNAAQQKTFLVTVNPPALSIPIWIKEVAAFWCEDRIDDSSFIEGIQYLIDNNIIIITGATTVGSGGQEIPSWIKNNACWWSQGLISDSDFAQGIQWLIQEGIIQV